MDSCQSLPKLFWGKSGGEEDENIQHFGFPMRSNVWYKWSFKTYRQQDDDLKSAVIWTMLTHPHIQKCNLCCAEKFIKRCIPQPHAHLWWPVFSYCSDIKRLKSTELSSQSLLRHGCVLHQPLWLTGSLKPVYCLFLIWILGAYPCLINPAVFHTCCTLGYNLQLKF